MRYTLNRPQLLREATAERMGLGARRVLFQPVVELPGAEALPMLANGELLPMEADKGKADPTPTEVRKYRQVVEFPDDIAKRLLAKGSINVIEEPKKAAPKAAPKPAPKEEKKDSKETK